MIFPGFPSIQAGTVSNPPVKATLNGAGDASFAEVALGLIGSPSPAAPPAASRATPATASIFGAEAADKKAGTVPVSVARVATGTVNATSADNADHSVARAPASAEPSPTLASSAAVANSNTATAADAAASDATRPVALNSSQTQSIFSSVLTPAQYLENAMAEIQAGAPISSDTPMTVAQVLQQILNNNYSTPENPYAECSDPTAAAALIARIAGPNANVVVPTVASMTAAPARPAGFVGNYTVGYATQSSGFNDAGETFGG